MDELAGLNFSQKTVRVGTKKLEPKTPKVQISYSYLHKLEAFFHKKMLSPQAKETFSYDKYDLNMEDWRQQQQKKNKKQKAKYMVTTRDRDTKDTTRDKTN